MEKDKLIAIWSSLESLVVSLDRIGSYEIDNGKQAALKALDDYFSPESCKNFSQARMLINELIENEFPGIGSELESLAENEASMGYWQYPKQKNT